VVGGPYYLTLGPVDLTDTTEVSVRFQRRLNSDGKPYVYATVEGSNNGTTWTEIWSNGTTVTTENAWSLKNYDISAIAANQPTFYVRWGYRISNGAFAYSGWNIDDVEIWGISTAVTPGDLNGDRDVNMDDVPLFVDALLNLCVPAADLNGDSSCDGLDVQGFIAALLGG
jgi:hypothetical protein